MSQEKAGEINWTNRRRYQRSAVVWSGRVMQASKQIDCVVLNLSANGAKVQLMQPADKGSLVTLFLEDFGTFVGQIAWMDGDTAGVTFLDEPDKIAEVLAKTLPRLNSDN